MKNSELKSKTNYCKGTMHLILGHYTFIFVITMPILYYTVTKPTLVD